MKREMLLEERPVAGKKEEKPEKKTTRKGKRKPAAERRSEIVETGVPGVVKRVRKAESVIRTEAAEQEAEAEAEKIRSKISEKPVPREAAEIEDVADESMEAPAEQEEEFVDEGSAAQAKERPSWWRRVVRIFSKPPDDAQDYIFNEIDEIDEHVQESFPQPKPLNFDVKPQRGSRRNLGRKPRGKKPQRRSIREAA